MWIMLQFNNYKVLKSMAEAYEMRQKIYHSLFSSGNTDKKDVIYLYHILTFYVRMGKKCEIGVFCPFSYMTYHINNALLRSNTLFNCILKILI